MELSEGLIDDITDFLKCKGVIKTKWKGRDLKQGADGLCQMLGPMNNFKDEEMLRIVKILKKRDGDEVFSWAGWTNTEGGTSEYTFLDLALSNGNIKTVDWLLSNVKTLWLANSSIENRGLIKDTQWFKDNGLRLLEYISDNEPEASRNAYEPIIYKIYGEADKKNWLSMNDVVSGILETKSEFLRQRIGRLGTSFVRNDDLNYVKWILEHYHIHFYDDVIIKNSPKNGTVNDYLNDFPEIVQYATSNAEKLGVKVEDWVPDEAKDIFLF